MSELNDRDFDHFGITFDYENQNLIVSDGILRLSDIICVDSSTLIFPGDIERDLISPQEITVLFSTFKDLNVVSSAFKLW
jgi:hypothetical protein